MDCADQLISCNEASLLQQLPTIFYNWLNIQTEMLPLIMATTKWISTDEIVMNGSNGPFGGFITLMQRLHLITWLHTLIDHIYCVIRCAKIKNVPYIGQIGHCIKTSETS